MVTRRLTVAAFSAWREACSSAKRRWVMSVAITIWASRPSTQLRYRERTSSHLPSSGM
ncbi:hypothetical protein D3C72_1137290 [compost metagenome]